MFRQNQKPAAFATLPLLVILALPMILAACGDAPPPPPPAIELPVISVTDHALPSPLNYTARARGEREVEVRARVSGILLRRYYREGDRVTAGARLFLIDPAPFAAELRSAQGRLDVAEARLLAAARQWQRVQPLASRGFVSRRSRDDAEADHVAARAAVATANADVTRAQLNLGYTDVRAPIGGITGLETRSEGSIVRTDDDSALLTTITQADRLDIVFSMPDGEARMVRAALAANPEAVRVKVYPTAGEPIPQLARIDFVNVQVASGTGTVEVRAVLANDAGLLAPGQFVRAEIVGLTTGGGVYVPARAVLHGADGPYVWVMDKARKAAMQRVRLGAGIGNLTRIESGLQRGDRVIVDGVLKLQPGMDVKPAGKAGAR